MRFQRFLLALALSMLFLACDDSSGRSEPTLDTSAEDVMETQEDLVELVEDLGSDQDLTTDLEDADASEDGDTLETEVEETTEPDQDLEEDLEVEGCEEGTRACGEACCQGTEVCTLEEQCCPRDELCGMVCCGEGEVCEGALCRLDCGENTRCTDESGAEVCCGEDVLCTGGACFLPQQECEDFIDCAPGEYCEATLGYCLPQPTGEVCQEVPVGGDVQPTLLWAWSGTEVEPAHRQVMMSPMVAMIDDDEIPDVAFNTWASNYTYEGILRVVSGADGSTIFDVTDPTLRTVGGGQIAIGDIDGDQRVELVTCYGVSGTVGGLIAFNHDGSLLWLREDARIGCNQAGPSIADLDADGQPEVFVRYTVLNGLDGEILWHQACDWSSWGGTAHIPCDYTTAADLDQDGFMEVIGGNVAFTAFGEVFYDRRADFVDGYPSLGDLDLDGEVDVVVVQSGFDPSPYAGYHTLRVLNHDGTDKWVTPVDINQTGVPQSDLDAGTVAGGGPATIANFDDDPRPEIALAGAYSYSVFEDDGTLKWSKPTHDRSSRKTGSSVFDFDGDGIAEAVYNDEYWLRVYDGTNGDVRFCQCNPSATHWEYPVIADVNNDGAAEIVLAANTSRDCSNPPQDSMDPCTQARFDAGETAGFSGVRVFASPTRDWVGTRKIWNQHTYHVTNVAEDGSIPVVEAANWKKQGLNNFRQNVQPNATNLANVQPIDLAVDLRGCPAQMRVNFWVKNIGWSAAPVGLPVSVYVSLSDGAPFELVGTVHTTRLLLSGESELLGIDYPAPEGVILETARFQVVVNDPTQEPMELLECDPLDNSAEVEGTCFFN